jgi:hypothetical protein
MQKDDEEDAQERQPQRQRRDSENPVSSLIGGGLVDARRKGSKKTGSNPDKGKATGRRTPEAQGGQQANKTHGTTRKQKANTKTGAKKCEHSVDASAKMRGKRRKKRFRSYRCLSIPQK